LQEQREARLPFLQKPFSLEALLEAVRQALEGAHPAGRTGALTAAH
jgi:FixJ family two-component response regulator